MQTINPYEVFQSRPGSQHVQGNATANPGTAAHPAADGPGAESVFQRGGVLALGVSTLVILSLIISLDRPFRPKEENYQVAYTFRSSQNFGTPASGRLTPGADGALLGATLYPPAIYKLQPDSGTFELLHVFSADGSEGYTPAGGLLLFGGGMLFGTSSTGGRGGGGTIFRVSESADGLCVIHHFGVLPEDGWGPASTLVQGVGNALYGTTFFGGKHLGGTVFKLLADGSEYSILHHFGGERGDGSIPNAGLTVGPDGKLYGATVNGGAQALGCVFRINPEGQGFEILHDFGHAEMDGANPYAALLVIRDSLLFGTASSGGKYNVGVIYCLNLLTLQYEVVHHFNGRDGAFPQAELIEGPEGWLYGTTARGGEFDGTVYKFHPGLKELRVLHRFAGSETESDGANPYAGVVVHEGAVYGTTKEGGKEGFGTIYRCQL